MLPNGKIDKRRPESFWMSVKWLGDAAGALSYHLGPKALASQRINCSRQIFWHFFPCHQPAKSNGRTAGAVSRTPKRFYRRVQGRSSACIERAEVLRYPFEFEIFMRCDAGLNHLDTALTKGGDILMIGHFGANQMIIPTLDRGYSGHHFRRPYGQIFFLNSQSAVAANWSCGGR